MSQDAATGAAEVRAVAKRLTGRAKYFRFIVILGWRERRERERESWKGPTAIIQSNCKHFVLGKGREKVNN